MTFATVVPSRPVVMGILLWQLIAAAASAQTTAPLAASPTSIPAWRLKFDTVYALDPGQPIKYLPPPFMEERLDHWLTDYADRSRMHPEPPVYFDFIVRGTQRRMRSAGFADQQTLSLLLGDLLNLRFPDFTAPPDLMAMPIPGDWIIREDALKDPLTVPQLASVLSAIRGKKVKIEHVTMPVDSIVVAGNWNFNQFQGWPQGVQLFIDTLDAAGDHDPPRSGSFKNLLSTIEQRLYLPVIDESEGAPTTIQQIFHHSFTIARRPTAPESDEKVQMVLKNLSDQTGLSWTREKRPREIWKFDSE